MIKDCNVIKVAKRLNQARKERQRIDRAGPIWAISGAGPCNLAQKLAKQFYKWVNS